MLAASRLVWPIYEAIRPAPLEQTDLHGVQEIAERASGYVGPRPAKGRKASYEK